MSNEKGEPLTEIACLGGGRTQLLGKRKITPADGYTCGFMGHGVKNPHFVLPAVPEGRIRYILPQGAGAFCGYNTRFATPEETASIAGAGDILKRGKAQLPCK